MSKPLPSPEALEKLPLYDLISLLDDVHVPEPVSYFPVTPLWTWIFWIVGLIGLFLLYKVWQHRQRERYRKVACKALERTTGVRGPAYVMKVSQILKWTALATYPRKQVANLNGEDWLRFLDSKSGGTEFVKGAGRTLVLSPYRRSADVLENELGALAKKWIKKHRRGGLS